MHISSRRSAALFGSLALALAMGACGSSTSSDDDASTLDRLKESGEIVVAVGNEAPYTKVEPDGSFEGLIPDLTRAALKSQGIEKVTPTVTGFDSMISGLKAKQWDAIAEGLLVTKARCAEVIFSEPTSATVESIVTKAGNPKGITGYKSVASSGAKLALIPNTAYWEIALANGVPEKQLVSVPDAATGLEAVKAGRADGTMILSQTLKAVPGGVGDLEVQPEPPTEAVPQITANAFRKDDTELRDAFNRGLDKVKESGDFDTVLTKWGFDPELARQAKLSDVDPSCS